MSLRLRLILVILTVVAVMGVVSSISFRINRGIHARVTQLSRTSTIELEKESVEGQALAIEGHWDPAGVFMAEEVERLPWSRRPKLRGEIEEVDRENRTLTLFGRLIRITEETEYTPLGGEIVDPLEDLDAGRRVEVSCRVDREAGWVARKINARGIKSSSKVKGNITAARLGSPAQREIEIHGLRVALPAGLEMIVPHGPLYRMETATRMTLAVRECMTVAHELLKERYRVREVAEGDGPQVARALEDVEDRLVDAFEGFARHLAESRAKVEEMRRPSTARGPDEPATSADERIALWLDPLDERKDRFEGNVARLLKLAAENPDAAQGFLHDEFEPFLQDSILPLVQAYHLNTEKELAQELQSISLSSETAARVAIFTNVAGLVLALGLGLMVSRSISRPIQALKSAAQEVGRGNLETHVDVRSRDELGVLTATFNEMTERLAASTVSVTNLNNVIDSMAGSLFLLDPERRITSVNPAALTLLGYEEGDLIGVPFEEVCRTEGRDATIIPRDGEVVTIVEKTFLTRTGEPVPVSFSGAAMRNEDRSVRGFVCLAQDLTERLRMEHQIRRSLREKELLLREVHHRVKNNLQVISSLLDLHSRAVSDPRSLDKFRECQDCILSMVFIHDQLYRARDLEVVNLRVYIEQIVANLSQAYLVLPDRIGIRVEVEDASLDIDRALSCGLIVNELVTNALKHAFSEDEPGEISVACRRTEDDEYALEVSDSGRGFDGALGHKDTESLGLSLVNTLVDQLRGRIGFDGRDGAAYRIEFPVHPPEEVS